MTKKSVMVDDDVISSLGVLRGAFVMKYPALRLRADLNNNQLIKRALLSLKETENL